MPPHSAQQRASPSTFAARWRASSKSKSCPGTLHHGSSLHVRSASLGEDMSRPVKECIVHENKLCCTSSLDCSPAPLQPHVLIHRQPASSCTDDKALKRCLLQSEQTAGRSSCLPLTCWGWAARGSARAASSGCRTRAAGPRARTRPPRAGCWRPPAPHRRGSACCPSPRTRTPAEGARMSGRLEKRTCQKGENPTALQPYRWLPRSLHPRAPCALPYSDSAQRAGPRKHPPAPGTCAHTQHISSVSQDIALLPRSRQTCTCNQHASSKKPRRVQAYEIKNPILLKFTSIWRLEISHHTRALAGCWRGDIASQYAAFPAGTDAHAMRSSAG